MVAEIEEPTGASDILVVAASGRIDGVAFGGEATGFGELPRTSVLDPTASADELERALAGVAAMVIDGSLEAPFALARRARRLVPELQLVLVAPPEEEKDLRRSMLFTPGLGQPWIVTPGEITGALLREAADVGRKRRGHRRRVQHLSRQVEEIEPVLERPPILSNQYLAALLELLPDPVLALGKDDRILFANPVAEDVFGFDAEDGERVAGGGSDPTLAEERFSEEGLARGWNGGSISSDTIGWSRSTGRVDASTALGPEDPAALQDLLEGGRKGGARGKLVLRARSGGRRTFDIAVAPVAGEHPIRALLLHDVTDEVVARETLENQAARLERQGRERERLLRERDLALEELKAAMHHRSRFYASMSHELRTPLNAIVGYNDLLLNNVFGEVPDNRRHVLDHIRRASNHLKELINDVLDLSKIESGKLTMLPEEVDMRVLMANLTATMEPLAKSKDTELHIDVSDGCGTDFRTDPRRVRQILMNLVSNAIEYGEGNPVDVRCRRHEGTMVIEVEDRGRGIPPDRIEEVFEEFVQLAEAEEGGTGLGLPIARSVAEAMGGEIEVTSKAGEGSVFTVTLPEMDDETGTDTG